MDQVVPQSHLVLLLGLVEVTIKHLKYGVLGVDLTIVVLLIDLNLLLERFSFGEAKPFTPLSQDLHTVQVTKALLLDHLSLEVVSALPHENLLLVEVFERLLCRADTNHLATCLLAGDLPLDELS